LSELSRPGRSVLCGQPKSCGSDTFARYAEQD